MNNDEYLRQKAFSGLAGKGLNDKSEYVERLEEELNTIEECGLCDFMLVTAYNVLLVKSKGIPTGAGRGSAGGSLLSYCIGITDIDPIKYNLSFSRFLNKARIKTGHNADIDIDTPKNDRQEVIRLLKESWGEDKTIQIVNDIYFTPKTILKDLGRIFGKSPQKMNKLTAILGDNDIEDVPEVMEFLDSNPEIKNLYPKLLGLIRASGTHAGGIIISDKPLTEYMGTLKSKDTIVSAYNGKTCEGIGLLKNDMLSLSTLDVIKDTLNFIGKTEFDFNYDLDDPKVYETINKSTLGIFQLEGNDASEYTKKLKPKCFNDIIADLALVRPGAKDSGDAENFLKVRFKEEEVHYDHPLLEQVLKETNGCILYQEQAMEISRLLSGFTDVEADNLRRGIGKKLDYIFDEYKPKFINGAKDNGVSEDIATLIWDKIEKSASYSFNKSHSVGYSLLTYQTAYLKTYYPMEFYTAMINNTKSEEKRNKIYNEIKGLNKNLINPDINNSGQICMYSGDNIYLSFSLINGVGPTALKAIMENQPYKSFEDFMNRKTSKVNKGVVKALIESGVFDRFGKRRDKLYSIITKEEHTWNDKEVLYREFQRIKINPQNNLLDLYNLQDMGITKPESSIADIKDNTSDYKDFYLKLLPSEFTKKDNYAFLSVTDGFQNISLFVGKEFIPRYIDEINEVGTPLFVHVHGKGEKYSVVSLINLNDIQKNSHEYWFYTDQSVNKVQGLQSANPGVNVGYVSNINYFTSKNGNPCARYDVTTSDGNVLEGRIQVNPGMMVEGSFIFFTIGKNPVFLDIIQIA